eukprot:2393552-Pyramimonas_sp.AAC.1
MAPRAPQRLPRALEEAPRGLQDAPKTPRRGPHEVSKSLAHAPTSSPRGPREASQETLSFIQEAPDPRDKIPSAIVSSTYSLWGSAERRKPLGQNAARYAISRAARTVPRSTPGKGCSHPAAIGRRSVGAIADSR